MGILNGIHYKAVVEDQQFWSDTGQHVLEPTRASRVLDIVLSSQK